MGRRHCQRQDGSINAKHRKKNFLLGKLTAPTSASTELRPLPLPHIDHFEFFPDENSSITEEKGKWLRDKTIPSPPTRRFHVD